jgi:hypothetical protein
MVYHMAKLKDRNAAVYMAKTQENGFRSSEVLRKLDLQ